MNPTKHPLKTVLVGTGNMSKGHLKVLDEIDAFQLTALCDANPENLAAAEADPQITRYTDIEKMLKQEAADLVIIATPNTSHAPLTIAAAKHAPKAILCEKPMSTHYHDAIAMVEACETNNVELLINHQRRLIAGATGRKAIEDGLIGELLELKGHSAGDFLSDGTHTIDTLLCLGGDRPPKSLIGAIDTADQNTRYGHNIETSATATWLTADFVRYEASSGDLDRRYPYQSYRIRGTKGELWHPGGQTQPQWFLNDGTPGDHAITLGHDKWYPLPTPSEKGPWRLLNPNAENNAMHLSLERLAQRLNGGTTPHPLNGRRTLMVQEIINATYLSALKHQRIEFPLPKDTSFVIDALTNPEKQP